MFYTNRKHSYQSTVAKATEEQETSWHFKKTNNCRLGTLSIWECQYFYTLLAESQYDQTKWGKTNSEGRCGKKSKGNLSYELKKIRPQKEKGQGKKDKGQNTPLVTKVWREYINDQVELSKADMCVHVGWGLFQFFLVSG